MDIIVNWFILVLVSVFDPLAVSLVIAANHLRHKELEKQIPPEDDNSPPPSKKEEITEDVIEVSIPPQEIKSTVETQITDAVTINKKQKNKKEKFDEEEIQRAFYEEQPKPDLGYRRGISL
jgi:hypothetical protein